MTAHCIPGARRCVFHVGLAWRGCCKNRLLLYHVADKSEVVMDIVFLRDLRIETVIGIYDWERKIKQTVVLDLEMGSDVRKAAATEKIEDALNYKAVAKRMIAFVGDSQFQLVETLAERCAEIILNEFEVPWVRLSVNKIGAVSGARDVGVLIERGVKD
jgi:dihydroneopterin aldolase